MQAEKSKREIFSFFSKKFSSEDINSEENHLVKFSDLIQYLNHYPVEWNKELELDPKYPLMSDKLKEKIIDLEIDRAFPIDKTHPRDNELFHIYARYKIWGKKYLGRSIERIYRDCSFTEKERERFDYEIDISPKLKDAEKKLKQLELKNHVDTKAIDAQEQVIKKLKEQNEPNKVLEKLQNRIAQNLLFVSYGRNKDRFMVFASRYLAEINYFGKEAMYKTYRFYSTDEQNNELAKYKLPDDKKEYDKLKFHQGKLIHFSTYRDHLERYPSWDTPFVIENNAIQIKTSFAPGIERIVSIQRSLMVYLLEDVLFHNAAHNENSGKELLAAYFFQHQKEFEQSKSILIQEEEISAEQKTAFKKILPKRLLNHYAPALQNNLPEHNSLQLLLDKTIDSAKRYDNLLEKAKKDGNYENFMKRNKGKQFKLQFMRKAWHLMYFKESYNRQLKQSGDHHKDFHIARDEFNDFCRYMFAFDEVGSYKIYLSELFEKKGFFENREFKTLFQSGTSLDNLYVKTKQAYQNWLQEQGNKKQEDTKYTLAGYEKFFSDQMFYINLSHFIKYLETTGKLQRNEHDQIRFKALDNASFLIPDYYYADKLEKAQYKAYRKLYNQLQTVKLEDTLLFEIAMSYFRLDKEVVEVEKMKDNVVTILTKEVKFDIKDINGTFLYHLTMPFNKIESYVGLVKHKEKQEQGKSKSSFLANLVGYLEIVKQHKDIQSVYDGFIHRKVLQLDDLNKIDNHLISNSFRFTNLALTMELYFINKSHDNKPITIQKDNRIEYDEIPELKKYFVEDERNKAFHFGVPIRSYEKLIEEIETKFVRNEVKTTNPKSYNELNMPLKAVCTILLETMHNNFFGGKGGGKEKREDAEQRFYKEVIERIN